MISIWENHFRENTSLFCLILLPGTGVENVPCALEKKVYSFASGWNVLKISMRSISLNVSCNTCVSLLIFCFDDLSIGVSGMLKSPTIIVLLSISPFMSVFVLCTEVLLCWVQRYVQLYVFLLDWSLDHYGVSFLISCNLFYFKVYFVWYEACYSSFLLLPIFMEYIFPCSHLQSQRRQWHPTPVLFPGKSHGWRSLVGCSPWGR